MVDHFCLIRNFLSSSNGCELINHGHRFVKLRKYLCFCYFMQQRKIFCSIKRIFSPKQQQIAPQKDVNLRPLPENQKGISDSLKGLTFFIFSSYERSECFISERSGDASYCAVKRNNASSSGFYEARLCRMKRHVVP